MLNTRNFELDYLRELQGKYRKAPALLERVLYAFGLCQACQVMYFSTCLLKGKEYIKIENPENYIDCNIADKKYKGLNKMKKTEIRSVCLFV